MNFVRLSINLLLGLLLAGCGTKSSCPQGRVSYLGDPSQCPPDTSASLTPQKTDIEIKNKTVAFYWIIEGPLCNDAWESIVYVGCDLTLQKWKIQPFFLINGFELVIKPDTVVYIAAQNNAAYYKGCSSCY